MFDMGFEPQVMRIIDNVRPDRQTVMFSATFPRQMEALARRILNKPIEIQVSVVMPVMDVPVERSFTFNIGVSSEYLCLSCPYISFFLLNFEGHLEEKHTYMEISLELNQILILVNYPFLR